jgi:phospholipid/cholesterol/gamma-HCH transport system ATP-binding protein
MSFDVNENEVLKADNISFYFGDAARPLLENLNLILNRSEVLFLIGPSEMGKSTLLKLLTGLYRPLKGEVFLQGVSIEKLSKFERKKALKKISMTFQRSGLFDSKTVRENLTFPLQELTELSKVDCDLLVEKVLSQVKLTGNELKYPFELSGGMQKRLGIARALILNPEVILYDDPTAGLDPITSNHILDLILSVQKEKGTATLIATSDLELALRVSQQVKAKICFLFEGKIIQEGSGKELIQSKNPVIYQFTRGLLEGPLGSGGGQ